MSSSDFLWSETLNMEDEGISCAFATHPVLPIVLMFKLAVSIVDGGMPG